MTCRCITTTRTHVTLLCDMSWFSSSCCIYPRYNVAFAYIDCVCTIEQFIKYSMLFIMSMLYIRALIKHEYIIHPNIPIRRWHINLQQIEDRSKKRLRIETDDYEQKNSHFSFMFISLWWLHILICWRTKHNMDRLYSI